MSTLRPYKFLVLPVLQEVDESGMVVRERQPEAPDAVFGLHGLHEYADNFTAALQQIIAQQNGQPTQEVADAS